MTEPEAQRIDKWLWHARFARTRSAAQRLALSGHVRVNREKVSAASRLVRAGDVLTLALGPGVRVIRICGIAARRGSFDEARTLYQEQGGAAPGTAGAVPGNEFPIEAASAATRTLKARGKAGTPPPFTPFRRQS